MQHKKGDNKAPVEFQAQQRPCAVWTQLALYIYIKGQIDFGKHLEKHAIHTNGHCIRLYTAKS